MTASSSELGLCRSCGACCAYSREWPRFTTEDDASLERIPQELVDGSLGRMRCSGDRCSALVGEVGVETSCGIYDVRPEVCRACQPADEACTLARRWFGLPPPEQASPISRSGTPGTSTAPPPRHGRSSRGCS